MGVLEQLDPEAYRALYEHSPDGVLFTATDGRVLAANPAACEVLGRSEPEICALGRQMLVDPGDERWAQMLAERSRTGRAQGVGRMLRGDGEAIEVDVSSRVFRTGRGEEHSCTIIRDVTDRVRLERELSESRRRLEEAERVAQTGSFEWDLGSDRVTWSAGMFLIYGIEPGSFGATSGDGLRPVYPGDREIVRGAFERAIAAPAPFALEYRVVRSDGRLRTLSSQGEVIVDHRGEPVRVVGIVRDVTNETAARQVLESTSSELERRAGELQRLLAGGAEHEPSLQERITARQLEILRLIAAGMTNARIAERLFLTEATVKWHVKQILARTGSANRAEAVARVLGRPHGGA